MKTQIAPHLLRILSTFSILALLAFAAGCGGGEKAKGPVDTNDTGDANGTVDAHGTSHAHDTGDANGTVDANGTGHAHGTGDANGTAWWQKKAPKEIPDKDKLRIAFVTNMIADFWNIAKAGCRDAEKELGVKVEVKMPPEATVIKQKQIVEDLVSSGIQAIAISPLDADNQIQWLDGIAAQVPLITHDSDAPGSKRRVYIGMDNYKAGRMCGELVKEALPKGGAVMLFIGRLEQDNSKHRRQGVIDELFDRDRPETLDQLSYDPHEGVIVAGKYKILGTMTDQGKTDVAKQKAADSINKYPDMKAMVGLFEYNPPACYQALKQAGKLGKIKLIGFDENDVTLQGIKDGYVTGTIVQNPYEYGYQSVKVLKDILEGKPTEAYIDIPPRKIVRKNVDEYWADLRAKKEG